jgi:DNA-damage-inducible protein D
MNWLGYETMSAFHKAVNKAISACSVLNIPILENFTEESREIDGKVEKDYRLSRFACYLTTMNGDNRKPQVAKAQAYFASLAQTIQNFIQESEGVERVIIRDEITDQEKTLSATACKAGVTNYPLFQNAGYRGLYNMDLFRLNQRKGIVKNRPLLDFMGKEELAANLFRITQTEAKIRNDRVTGQRLLEDTAEQVGRKVRATMREISGTTPESLPITQDIKQVRTGLKSTHRELKKLDANKKQKK